MNYQYISAFTAKYDCETYAIVCHRPYADGLTRLIGPTATPVSASSGTVSSAAYNTTGTHYNSFKHLSLSLTISRQFDCMHEINGCFTRLYTWTIQTCQILRLADKAILNAEVNLSFHVPLNGTEQFVLVKVLAATYSIKGENLNSYIFTLVTQFPGAYDAIEMWVAKK